MSERPAGLGRFTAGDLSFEVDDGLTLVSLEDGVEVDEQALDQRLEGVEGPIASWLLARLKHLCRGSLELDEETVEVVEGAVYVVDFVVKHRGTPAGKVQLQAGEIGAALLGVVSKEAGQVTAAFVEALLEQPEAVARCRVRVRDPSWPTERPPAEYGFDGEYIG